MVYGKSAVSAAVYSGLTTMPSGVVQFKADTSAPGADLAAEKRARLEALQTELAQLTQKYAEHVLDATNAWQLVVTEEARLAGLPAHAKAAARANAEQRGLAGWRFTPGRSAVTSL